MVVCKFFLQGTCKFGANCRFEHPTNQGNSGGGQATVTDVNTLITSVQTDMNTAEKGGQWLLTCYAPFKEKPMFPGFEEMSFEEVRVGFYEATKSGTADAYKQQLQGLFQSAMQKVRTLQNPGPDLVNILKEIYNTTAGGGFQSGRSNVSNVFGGAQQGNKGFGACPPYSSSPFGGTAASNSPFGATAASNSPFGGGAAAQQNPFGSQSAAPFNAQPFGAAVPGNSPFGAAATSSSSLFGGSAAATASNAPFGGTASTPFGAASGSTPFGQAASSPFGAQASSNPFGQASNSPFGAAPNATNNSPFGAQQTATNNSPFGTQQPANPFGAPPQSTFGMVAANSPFGVQQPVANSNSLFGAVQQQPVAAGNGLFGAVTQPVATTNSVFGAVQQPIAAGNSLFGAVQQPVATNSSLFGAVAPGNSVFGGSQQPAATGIAPFGQQPSNNVGFGAQVATPSLPFGAQQQQQQQPFGGQSSNFAADQNSPFGQSPFGASLPQSTQMGSIFGGSVQQVTIDAHFYSKPEELSEADMTAFQNSAFEFGKIPELPPPSEMCI